MAGDRLTLRALNRATLDRQGLLDPFEAPVSEVVARVAGLQAQHATWPYVALWSRRAGHTIADLEQAITGRAVVKATLMRTTLHLVAAADYAVLDTAASGPRLTTWGPSARRAGLDLVELNEQTRAFCDQPRTVAEIEGHLAGLHPGADVVAAVPAGVRNLWFRLGTAAGGLVHVPPSGLWSEHGRPAYVSAEVWLGELDRPSPEAALVAAVERFLTAYGPASLADVMKWAGQHRKTATAKAVAALEDRLVRYTGPAEGELVDLAGRAVPEDAAAPPRFLARWDSALIAYAERDRILPPAHGDAVVKKNGDFLPTFLVDGFVAGLWAVDSAGGVAGLTLTPFGPVRRADRAVLEEGAEALVRFLEPEAASHTVRWAGA